MRKTRWKYRRILLAGLFTVLTAFRAVGDSSPICISEIQADNKSTCSDEDGDYSDWIEIYNYSDSPVSLDGWYLTDNAADLTQWNFPATNIAAKSFLIVFASDKNRSAAGAELHSNFKLSASGEYVALVRPDGSTVEHSFVFPALQEDVSYGYDFSSGISTVILNAAASCTAHIPTGADDANGWKENGFNDSGWLSGTTGVGYEESPGGTYDYSSLIGLDVSDMRYVNATVYIRVPFTVNDANKLNSLTLKMKYEDAFTASINGDQVLASDYAPSSPVWNSEATQWNDDENAVTFEEYDLTASLSTLQEGVNPLAIHGMNKGSDSSDLLFLPRLEATYAGDVDTSEAGVLSQPTPGQVNAGISYGGYVETPTVYPARGFYDDAFLVYVSNITDGATIRYTLDGSEPTSSSTIYSGPISISETRNLRIRAFLDNWKPSPSRTDTYIFVNDVAYQPVYSEQINGQDLSYGMDAGVRQKTYRDASNQVFNVQDALKAIPSISITTDHDNLYDSSSGIYVNASQHWERPASIELLNPDGSDGFQINAGLRIRGGWSRHSWFKKHSFRLFFRKEYGAGKLKYALFGDEGVDEFDKVDLRTAQNYSWASENSIRNTLIRDVVCRDAAGAMGDAYTRSRYYHLYLNGDYWGLFMTEERPEANYAASYFGGDSDDYDTIKVNGWTVSPSYVIAATDGTTDAYRRLYTAAMNGFSDNADYFAVQGLNAQGEPDPAREKLLDLNNAIDYVLLISYVAASDNCISAFGENAGINNIYAIYNRVNPDGFKWIQHDCEHALDTTTSDNRTGPYNSSNFNWPDYFNAQTLHDRLTANAEYRLAFADRVYKHLKNGGALVQSNMQALVDYRSAQIDRAIVANAARWGSTSLDRDTWVSAVATTRNWLNGREQTLINYLDADGLIPSIEPPQLSRGSGLVDAGTAVSLSSDEGTIYYTTDGTDPRAIGGGIAGASYGSSISIIRPTHLKARARKSNGEWSALTEATFWTSEIPLAVTELMYHAPDGNPHDYIEIKNISDQTVTLKGYKVDNAVEFKLKNGPVTLGPNQYLVIVDDLDAFATSYSTNNIIIAGEFSGDFKDGGEKVDLEFRNNDLISFKYSDARNWPLAADGAGHSLVPRDSAMDDQEHGSLNYGGNWRASTHRGGSPGYADPEKVAGIVINEIIAHTDTGLPPPFDSNDSIELYNSSPSPIILNGWYLSDDKDNLMKFAIPNGTTIPAFGYAVFDEDDFHPGRTSGFGLNKAGEQVFLSAPERIVDSIRFKGQENGVSLGRYPDGSASWLTTFPSPGSPNQPIAASLQISELMYHPLAPAGVEMEYIQLENVGNSVASLYNTTGPYRIDGGVSYTFPLDITLDAGDKLWLVSFDPADNGLLTEFRSTYGLSISDRVFGPYRGELSNQGERVALERPQDSDDPLFPLDISWVVVDELFYFDQAPWPGSADGTGNPLVRTGLSSWKTPAMDTDSDGDQLPDYWEQEYFSSLEQIRSDWDEDGRSNYEEFIAGTDPTDSDSVFTVETTKTPTLYWTPRSDRTYSIYWTDDISQPFVCLATGLTSRSYTDTLHSSDTLNFYRIQVDLQ